MPPSCERSNLYPSPTPSISRRDLRHMPLRGSHDRILT
ncbi:MAG: hypothetical protein AVDCRST_MAG47-3141 [uncultured Nocardioidaceae bacterium]|uniref:Uncharacterized protein n=1 Tax=uncultured Nocardioidaceae bacterium TaxID=253824 RepID=A0A6J4NWV0_9ACTN|nr:MAG: hypothetical protein AVDCRST_MAG47-3141 [uncultured Nocardioidaceae bacterium]